MTAILVVSVLAMLTAVASATTRSVCAEGCDFTNITLAEAASSSYDTIIVHDGTYSDNVDVDVAHLTVQSQNGADSTTVQSQNVASDIFYVNADYVNISGFTVTGGDVGIYLSSNVDHCNISDNNALENYCGIYLESSSNNEFTNNTANSNNYGITLVGSNNNNITCNWVAHNDQQGFYLESGSTGNNISYNNIMHNGVLQADGSYHWNFYNYQSDAVVAEHNYWGTTDPAVIAAGIKGDTGSVDYDPFETSPPPCAPIPEAATIILFSIGLVVLAGYVWMRKRF